jgi:DNA-binding HxlR family transcriptional regulator
MLRREYENQNCSIARTLEVVGERWSLLIVRDVLLGVHRFDDLVERLRITRSVLTVRLERLVGAGVLSRQPYQQRPVRYEYHLTDKGRQLWPILIHLMRWGDEHYAGPQGPPRVFEHIDCGGHPDDHLCCDRCAEPLHADNTKSRRSPTHASAGREHIRQGT